MGQDRARHHRVLHGSDDPQPAAISRPVGLSMLASSMARRQTSSFSIHLKTSCARRGWQVPVQPLRWQDEAQVEQDRRECDNAAKTSSGYSRAVEAKTWLWGIFIVAPAVAVSAAVDYVTFSKSPVMETTGDAVTSIKPTGDPNFETYFTAYRACMEARGYRHALAPSPASSRDEITPRHDPSR